MFKDNPIAWENITYHNVFHEVEISNEFLVI